MTKQPKGWYVIYCETDDYTSIRRYRYLDAIEFEKTWDCTHLHTIVHVHKEWTRRKYKGGEKL